jgi:hypothetical protein
MRQREEDVAGELSFLIFSAAPRDENFLRDKMFVDTTK